MRFSVRNLGRPLNGVQNNTRGQQMRTGRRALKGNSWQVPEEEEATAALTCA